MKIKSLLLGSAAALMAFTSAQAADAVIAEPEAVEYVRVCDMYGNGFFYIPGTETCLRINGYVRSQYEYTDRDGQESLGEASFEARVQFDAREETDYGLLRSFIRLEAGSDNDGSGRNAVLNQAYIQLGGFTTGYRDGRYIETYGHGGLMLDGNYPFQRVGFADYTFAGNGLSVTGGVQIDARTEAAAGLSAEKSFDPYLFASYAGSSFSVSGGVAYDTSAEVLNYRARLDVQPLDGLGLGVWYYGSDDPGSSIMGDEHVVGAYASYSVNSSISVAAGYDWTESHTSVETSRYTVGLDWKPVSNLNIRTNFRHTDPDGNGNDSNEIRVRIERSF